MKRTREERRARADRKKRAFRQKAAYQAARRSAASIPRILSIKKGNLLGNTHSTVLTYSDILSFDPATGSSSGFVWQANGLYDPNSTGAGHQPYGYDQLTALYVRWVVTASTIEFSSVPGDGGFSYLMGVCTRDSPTNFGAEITTTIAERPGVKTKLVSVNGSNIPVLKDSWDLKKWFNGSKDQNDDTLHGAQNANPTDGIYFHTFITPLTTTDNMTAVRAYVRMRFNVTFFDPRDVSAS